MNVETWLAQATKKLEAAGIGSARLDALILLEDELKKDRGHLLAHPEIIFQGGTLEILNKKLERRLKHEPIAYIRGFMDFYGRNFFMNRHVLEPRPESETMIELLKQLVDSGQLTVNSQTRIADVGTGSGAIAITVKLELPTAIVCGTEIDPKALKVARQNAKKLKADIKFFEGDLLQPLLATNDWRLMTTVVLANLPYVPDSWQINQAAMMEPRIAIFGGPDGLDVQRRFFEQLSKLKTKPRYIFTESLPPQHQELTKIAQNAGYKLTNTQDFIQIFESV